MAGGSEASLGAGAVDPDRLRRLLAAQDVRDVVYRYCRGVDRCDYDMIRGCYHADAVDDHGEYIGGVDGFIEHVETNLGRFERTMHFVGNVLVDVDGSRARSEAYTVAYHRLRASGDKPERDFLVGLRYVDDFEERDGSWRIAKRVCVFEWSRMDPVLESRFEFGDTHVRGERNHDDVVFAPSLDSPGAQ